MALNPVNSPSTSVLSSAPEPSRKAPVSAGSPTAKADEASFSAAASSLAAAAPDSASRIESIKAQIANGSYKPDSQAIASKMLEEALLSRR